MNAPQGFVVRTGNPEQDRYEVARYQQHYATQGLHVAAEPLAEGGFLLRVYPARPSVPPPEAASARGVPRTQGMQRVVSQSFGPDGSTQDAAAFGFVGFGGAAGGLPEPAAHSPFPGAAALPRDFSSSPGAATLASGPWAAGGAARPSAPPQSPQSPQSPRPSPSVPPTVGFAVPDVPNVVGVPAVPGRPRSAARVLLILLLGAVLGAGLGYLALRYSHQLGWLG